MNHPNIIKTVDFYEDTHLYNYKGKKSKNRYNFLVLELAVGDTLFEYLMKGEFSHPVARFYFKQLISALDHMYSKGYYHRDLKPGNLLMDEKFNLKLADFGVSRLVGKGYGDDILSTTVGTRSYMCPELH